MTFLCVALLLLLVGCGNRVNQNINMDPKDWILDQTQDGMAFHAPPTWTSGKEADTVVYTTPEKQVMTVNTIQSVSRGEDILNQTNREDFCFIAQQGALNSHFTSEDVIDVGGQNGLRVTYQTLNGTELMYVVHVGVVKENKMYFFLFLMPETANDSATFDQVVATVQFI